MKLKILYFNIKNFFAVCLDKYDFVNDVSFGYLYVFGSLNENICVKCTVLTFFCSVRSSILSIVSVLMSR